MNGKVQVKEIHDLGLSDSILLDVKSPEIELTNIWQAFSVEIDILIPKFFWKYKRPKTAKIILKKQSWMTYTT